MARADSRGDRGRNRRCGYAKVNVDEQPELAQQFGIMSIPTLVFFKEGRVTDTLVGLRDKAAILSLLK